MLYLSAQPDTTYFIWQLEIQLRNFHSLGITKDQIQILASFKPERGLNPDFQTFKAKNSHLANFYTYPDLRENPRYTSSIRPNILRQHFALYPELENKTLFYHDSDILFSRIPQIQDVENNDICYVSDTRNYLDIDYIRRSGSEQLLADMASIVGISVETIAQNNPHTGGAQYILKGITAGFWTKVERDSEELYITMRDYNRKLWETDYPAKKEFRSKKRGIQAWCADMWAVLWNLWLENKPVEIHKELDFSWPHNPIQDWDRLAIQHYSGNIEDKTTYFRKGEYINYLPWYDEALDTIPDSNCSYEIVQLIRKRRQELDTYRISYPNNAVILTSDKLNPDQERLFKVYTTYIQKHIDIPIKLFYNGGMSTQQLYNNNLQEEKLSDLNDYKSFLVIPLHQLLAIEQIQDLLCAPTNKAYVPQTIFRSDVLFIEAFSKMLEIQLLEENKGKFSEYSFRDPLFHVDKNVFTAYFLQEASFKTLHSNAIAEAYLLT